MIQSRCGILCEECSFREQMGCGGCISIDKPFWGDNCPIKDCSEQKNHSHCGECKKFPCDSLTQFSYDETNGDEGKRIEQCKNWGVK